MDRNPADFKNPNYAPNTLVDLLRWRAETQPDTRAYTYLKDGENKEITLTYGELDKRAKAIAVSLLRKGLSSERALLLYPPGLDYISGFFGCLYAGVIAVPAFPPDPSRLNRSLPRLQAIVNDSKATVALTTDSIYYMIKMLQLGSKVTSGLDKLPILRKFRTSMKYFSTGRGAVAQSSELGNLDWISTDSIVSSRGDDWQAPGINSDYTAFLQYTSGSTGNPKGVILSHNNLLHNSKLIHEASDLDRNTEGVFWLPIYHDMGLIGGVLQPLYAKIPSTLMSPLAFLQRPLRWLETISKVTDRNVGSAAPNFAYELCIKKATPEKVKQLDLSRWVYALSGAEPVRAQTIDRFSEVFKTAGFKKSAFYPAYGLAEATVFVTGSSLKQEPSVLTLDKYALKKNKIIDCPKNDENGQTIVSCGSLNDEQITKIVNPESFKECKEREIGEVWVKGPSVSLGYYQRPVETKETFQNFIQPAHDGPYLRTGDLAFVDHGELYITGRVKDLIIIRGTNHYPQDIELTIENAHPEVRQGCSAAFTIDADDQEQLVVVLEVKQSKNLNFDEIIHSVRQAISESHDLQAHSIVLIKARSINKTSSGKIQRRATRNEYLEDKLSVITRWDSSTDSRLSSPKTQAAERTDLSGSVEMPVPATETKSKEVLLIEEWLRTQLAETLHTEPNQINAREPFISFGLDSAQAVGLAGDLEEWLGLELAPTILWDYPTIDSLAKYLAGAGVETGRTTKSKYERSADYEPIAVIGLGAKFPGANNYKEFWEMLKHGIDGITEVPAERWDADRYFSEDPATPGKMITRNGGFIDNVEMFDADFFGISPREAIHIDPQQRLLMEVSWDALEHAGQTLDHIAGSRTGVFIGISNNDYSRIQTGGVEAINPYSGTGNAFSIAANRLSYIFDLHGPSIAIDTACSSSLVAIHNACQSLRDGDCDMALAGGVNLILSPELTITFSQARMMSADGKCKTFDASADGYGRGEGVGMVVLKRLSEAQQDGDRILAVVRGSALNQDGKSNGITAPNSLAQQSVIMQALENADIAPDQITYLETHGTGTILGDPIEIESIKKTLLQERAKDNLLFIGSVKTNIGHLESAAGIAGFMKAVLAVNSGIIPPHINFTKLNPHIHIDDTPIQIPVENINWPNPDQRRLAGVSAFGFGGTNAHVIVESFPEPQPSRDEVLNQDAQIFIFSAHSEHSLRLMAGNLLNQIRQHTEADQNYLYDLAFTLGLKRSKLDYRVAFTASDMNDLREKLDAFISGKDHKALSAGKVDSNFTPKIAFVYSGQGPQWIGMGRELMTTEPVFRATVERISFLLQEYTGWSLADELQADDDRSRLDDTEVAQPAIFAIQVALTAVWRNWHILPEAVIGHSVGEVAAAHVSGKLSLEDAVKVIYHRSRLMQQATGLGKMAAVDLPFEALKEKIAGLEDRISIGALNSVTSNVISGEASAIDEALNRLSHDDIFYRKLPVNYAFHSPQMEPFQLQLIESLEGIKPAEVRIPIISTVRGSAAEEADYNPEYWADNIREAVRFSDGINVLLDDGYTIFIEIGPHPVLKNYIKQNIDSKTKRAVVSGSMRRSEPERLQLLSTLCKLFVNGYPLKWDKIFTHRGRPVDLPFYPFQRERFWITDDEVPGRFTNEIQVGSEHHPLLGTQHPNALFPENSNWTVILKSDYVAYLNNGRSQSTPILPDTAYLEMAVAASKQTFQEKITILRDIVFKNVLQLRKNESRQLHFSLTPVSGSKANFQTFSKSAGADGKTQWIMHSLGSIYKNSADQEHTNDFATIEDLKNNLIKQPVIADYFHHLRIDPHKSMKIIETAEEIWSGDYEVLAKINLRKTGVNDIQTYHLHPVVLDNCFDLILATVQQKSKKPVFLTPHSIDHLKLLSSPSQELWVHIRINSEFVHGNSIFCQLHLLDQNGNVILDIHGLRLKPFTPELSFRSYVYETDWQILNPAKTRKELCEDQALWLIFPDDSGIGGRLRKKLKQKGCQCITAISGNRNAATAHDEIVINPSDKDGYNAILNRMDLGNLNIIYFWALNDPAAFEAIEAIDDVFIRNISGLWMVTRNGRRVIATDSSDPKQAHYIDKIQNQLAGSLSGNLRLIDIDEVSVNLFNAVQLAGNEQTIAVRENKLFIPRLTRSPIFTEQADTLIPEGADSFTDDHQKIENGLVEIEVKAIGLRPQKSSMHFRAGENFSEISGIDCSGIVSSVYHSDSKYKIGDEVVAYAQGKPGKYIIAREALVKNKPSELTFEEAATIPLSFISAQYALSYLGRCRENESILILDAANEFGLAALQVAKSFKLQIFATVDRRDKIAFVRQFGIAHVFESGSLDYVDAIQNLTNNRGVDIIFASAPGQSASAGFLLLKEFGRYLDLNTHVSGDRPMVYQQLRKNVSYFSIDMDRVIEEQSRLVQDLFETVMKSFEFGSFKPLAKQIYPKHGIATALKHMREDNGTGKHIISFSEYITDEGITESGFEAHQVFVVAGNFDSNDLALIDWMINHGAKHIYTIPLSEPYSQNEEDRNINPGIQIGQIDIEQLASLPNIHGLILSLSSITRSESSDYLMKKINRIYEIIEQKHLQFFITISVFELLPEHTENAKRLEITNSINVLNHKLNGSGNPAIQIRIAGSAPISKEDAVKRWDILSHFLDQANGDFFITDADWKALEEEFRGQRIPAFLSDLLTATGNDTETVNDSDISISREDILSETPAKRPILIEKYLKSEISKVVKVSAAKIDPDQSLITLGIDSLMAIELKNTVESRLGVSLPIATLLQGPSIRNLTDQFLPQLERQPEQSGAPLHQPASRKEIEEIKLSYGQKAMYFQHVMNPESIFNLAYAVRIRSAFDKAGLINAFRILVDRHIALRTTFHFINGQPIQRIHPAMELSFTEEDIAQWPDKQIRERLDKETLRHFDLEHGPLMRVLLLKKNPTDHILLFTMHHIVTDIWSQALLLNELSLLISNQGNISALSPVTTDYTDYIHWQDELLAGNEGEKQIGYWKKKLTGELPVLNIPTDYQRPSVQTYRGKTETIWFGDKLSLQIKQFCEQHGVTPFTMLLSAYFVLLHRYTGQKDIIIGSPTAGRNKQDFINIIGYFVNPAPFRCNLENNPTFTSLLAQVKETVLEAFEHMDYPLSLMVEKIQPVRDPSRTPFFQTMFILQRAHLMHDQGLSKFALSREGATLDLGGLMIESMNLEQGVAPFDLTMMAVESGSGLAASLGYNVDLFSGATVQRMLTHYMNLLTNIIGNPERPVSAVTFLSENEHEQLIRLWNNTKSDQKEEVCIQQIFENIAAENPEKVAVVFENQRLTYNQLNRKANQLAHFLIKKGVHPEDRIGICIDRSMEMVIAILGVMKAGAAYVPIDPSYPQERIKYMFTESGLSIILTQKHLVSKLESSDAAIYYLDNGSDTIWIEDESNPQCRTLPDNLAYIIYTSGSTGRPKGTMLHHRGLINALNSTTKNYYVMPDSNVLQFASFSFDASVEEIFSALTTGATVHLVKKETLLSLGELIQFIKEHKITNMTLPPSVLAVLQPTDFPSVRTVVSAGEKCPPVIAREWAKGRHFVNGYGPTEATICTTTFEVGESSDYVHLPIGKPVANARVYILDENFYPTPIGVPGELFIGGDGLARGYFSRPDRTAERFIPNPFCEQGGERLYRTGDLVRYLPDGNIEFIDRVDEQVKIRGYRIELGEVESAIKRFDIIKDAAVVARGTQTMDKQIVAYLVLTEPEKFDQNALVMFLKTNLPDFMIPGSFVQIDKLPLTSNGKLDKKALPDPEIAGTGQTFVKPGNEIERKLSLIWQEILGTDQVGVNDSFFDLGGHSLSVVQVQGKIKEIFDKEITVVDMFKYPTIRSLAKFFDAETTTKENIKKSQDRASRQREATKIQQRHQRDRRR